MMVMIHEGDEMKDEHMISKKVDSIEATADEDELAEIVMQCRVKVNSLLADLDSVEATMDKDEFVCAVDDAGHYFLGVAAELDE